MESAADSCAAFWGNLNQRNAELGREECDEAQQGQLHTLQLRRSNSMHWHMLGTCEADKQLRRKVL